MRARGTVVFIQSYSYFSPVHSTNKPGMILGPASTLALKGIPMRRLN